MTRRSTFKEADVARALRAAKQANLTVRGIEVEPGGTFRILVGDGLLSDAEESERRMRAAFGESTEVDLDRELSLWRTKGNR